MLGSLPLWMLLLALGVALCVDRWWGEPPLRWHPVAWMGHYLMWAGERIAPLACDVKAALRSPDWAAFGMGVAAWWGGAVFVTALAWGVQSALLEPQAYAGAWVVAAALLGGVLKPMLAWTMLTQEVQAVEAALQQSLSQGRERLSWICSRDTTQLSEVQVRETAIESLAENLNDSVVAPLFWFVCFGLPAAVLYRYANTADAMWGYRGVREGRVWEWAGKWAALVDDVLSWLPARLTALALMCVARCQAWSRLWQEARSTPSPNGGWPMSAMALALQVRLGKPGVYVLNAEGEAAQPNHVAQACALSRRAVMLLVVTLTLMLTVFMGAKHA